MEDRVAIRKNIVSTEAKLLDAEAAKDRVLILAIYNDLSEQRKRENFLLAQTGNFMGVGNQHRR